MSWLGYTLVYLAPLLTFCSYWGGNLYYGLMFLLTFGLIPLFDEWLGDDWVNPQPEQEKTLKKTALYSWVLYGFVPVQIGLLLWACFLVSRPTESLGRWLGLLFMVGMINGGFSINIAHELSHRKNKLEQNLAKLLWFRVGYMHFQIEHLLGHHPRMGTPEDHATARLGESLYQFYARCIPGSFVSAWQIEKERLKQKGYAVVSWHNQMFWFIGLPLIFCGVLYGLWGWQASLFYFLQALIAIFTLETVNYLEHYGLERRQSAGRYEKIGLQHSWNSSRRLSNYFLHKLQRHSDHHLYAHRPYQILRAFPEAPQLPTGYGWMVLLAFLPPLWYRIMNPRVLACRQREETSQSCEPQAELLA